MDNFSKCISPAELAELLRNGKEIQLIDVREPEENAEFNIGGDLMPLGTIQNQLEKIRKDIPVVVYCRKGIRSMIAIQKLESRFPFTNLINLTGGMEKWKKEVPVQ